MMQPGVSSPRQALREFAGHINPVGARNGRLFSPAPIFRILFAAAIFGYLVAIQNLPQQIASNHRRDGHQRHRLSAAHDRLLP